jgi:hypothetical protein
LPTSNFIDQFHTPNQNPSKQSSPMARVKEAAAEAAHAVAEGVADGAAAVVAAADAATTPSTRAAESLSAGTGKSGALSPRRAARLPGPARFVLAVVLSFALSELGRSFVNHWSNNEVGSIAREITSQKELAVLAGWKLYVLLPYLPNQPLRVVLG